MIDLSSWNKLYGGRKFLPQTTEAINAYGYVAGLIGSLRRDGDEFTVPAWQEPGAWDTSMHLLGRLNRRASAPPPAEVTSIQNARANFQHEWNSMIGDREKLRDFIRHGKITIDELQAFNVTREMLADERCQFQDNGLPPETWQSDAEAFRLAATGIGNMSPGERASIPQKLRAASLEQYVEAQFDWLLGAVGELQSRIKAIEGVVLEQRGRIEVLERQVGVTHGATHNGS